MTLCSPSFSPSPPSPLAHHACTLARAHRHAHKHLPLVGLKQLCHLPESIGGNRAEGLVTVYMRSQRLASHRPSCCQGNNTDLMHKVLAEKCEMQSFLDGFGNTPPAPTPPSTRWAGPGRATPTDPLTQSWLRWHFPDIFQNQPHVWKFLSLKHELLLREEMATAEIPQWRRRDSEFTWISSPSTRGEKNWMNIC